MSGITKRIAAAVEKSSLSYDEIEKELELPEGTVKKWLGGKEEPDTVTIKRLAPLLGVSADHLLFGVEKIGEMKAMFPNDVNPSPTPITDWRFLSGVIMVFVGAVAIMMMVMRYAGEGIGILELFEISAVPLIVFGIISVVGFAVCIITSVTALHIPKVKKNKEDKNEK